MTSEQWAEVRLLLDQALDQPALRPALLRELRGRDPEACAELERLITDLDGEEETGGEEGQSTPVVAGLNIGPYRIIREIGRGGAGTVFLAERQEGGLQVPFAVKLLRPDFLRGTIRRFFQRELRALARVDHPNIARLVDWGTVPGGMFYLALEYVDGLPITRYCADAGLNARARLDLFLQVFAAVEHAHRHLVVHRDLKPSNILVTAADNACPARVKLVDFGIASELDSSETVTMLNRAMTPAYASPEQIAGEPVSVASDIYSLGVMLYELLSGRLPEARDPLAPSARATLSEVPAREIAGDLDAIVLKAIQPAPEQRYPSVEEFVADVRRHLEGRPVEARRRSRLYVAGRFLRRNRWNVAAAALAVAALTATAAIAVWNWRAAAHNLAESQRDYKILRDFAQAVISNVDAKTAASPVEAQRRLSATIARYLDQLSSGRQNDEQLQLQIATAYNYLGGVQGSVATPNQGDPGAARANYEKAYRLALAQWRARASRSSGVLLITVTGNIALIQPDPATAVDFLSRGIEATHDLLSRYPSDEGVLEVFAGSYGTRGQRRRSAGDLAGAVADFETAVSLALRAQAVQRTAVGALSENEAYESEEGTTLRLEGRLQDALRMQTEARQIALHAVQMRPANHTRRQAAFKLLSRAETLRCLKQYADAARDARQAKAELQAIAEGDPADVQARIDFSLAEIRLGDIAFSRGRLRDALDNLHNAFRLRQEQYQRHPSNPLAIRAYQSVAVRLAEVELAGQARTEAAEHFQEASDLGVRLQRATPSDVYAAADLARAYRGAAQSIERQNPAHSLELLRQSVELWGDVHKRCPFDVELASDAAAGERALATLLAARSTGPAQPPEAPAARMPARPRPGTEEPLPQR